MDVEMEDSYEVEYTAVEIDLDYEYDAVQFFDFTREESPAEARRAELWFETAVTYPPSPFVARLLFGQKSAFLENVNTSPKPKLKENAVGVKNDQNTFAVARDNEGKGLNSEGTYEYYQNTYQKIQSQCQQVPSGFTFYNHMVQDVPKAKSSVKTRVPRTSTLMKPTASQLAKQSQPRQTISTRFQNPLVDKVENSTNNACKVEIQAPKRQKLEGGHLNKIGDSEQQLNFIHKMPKKDVTFDVNAMPAKMRITIPREPDLETTVRAQRTRRKIIGKEVQETTSTIRRFKALPLNRKILETPSLVPKRSEPRVPQFHEFHLKTSERAVHHTAAVSMPTVSCSDSNKELHKCGRNSTATGRDEIKRCKVMVDTAKEEKTQSSHNFKALPLNRKIFSSKGDIGVFRNNKREITVPKEFNFQTEKRAQHNPPIDLFNKLSLASEPKQKSVRPDGIPTKGSKENIWDPFPQDHQVIQELKEKSHLNGGRQVSYGANGRKTDSRLVSSATSKSLGVR